MCDNIGQRECSCGEFSKAVQSNSDSENMAEEYFKNIPAAWYVVEVLNMDGIVIWQAVTGEVFQVSPGTQPIKVCDSLAEYLKL